MIEIDDNVFGRIVYDLYWKRSYTLSFLNKDRDITLVIDGDEDGDFEDSQYKAFQNFEAIKTSLIPDVEDNLFKYYLANISENRDKFGIQSDKMAPLIFNKEGLDTLLDLKQVVVIESFDSNDLNIGLVFDAKWEPELGIGVKLINGKLVEIGYQDIVL
ncbi:hypothetical protein GZ78_27855 [Endozoicomonas numazuensis]|uniref:DUF6985 domain-containing protein n=2 Tax=Endozoicomonas numazuensis TaxID=1137799 RepID=A0A081N1C1_9GAMM|nr:hypothetical protein GZ78_27855 [Endozoicomonas numazuensis]